MFFSGISQKELESVVKAGDKFGSKDIEEIVLSEKEKEAGDSDSLVHLKQKKLRKVVIF